MHRLWKTIVSPLINEIKPKHIVEVGSEYGYTTKELLKYCNENDAKLTSIDPNPLFDVDELKNRYGSKFEMLKGLSLDKLPLVKDYDMILLDGDHNWYTIYHELKLIEKEFADNEFPLAVLHDISWPYARRDLYYNPDTIPEEFLNPYAKKGICPDKNELLENGGLNSDLYNALEENTPKNGVLTGIEDFLNETDLELTFKVVNAFHGLGILYPKNPKIDGIISEILSKNDIPAILEKHYIKEIIALHAYYMGEIKKYADVIEQKDEIIDGLNYEINQRDQKIARMEVEIIRRDQQISKLTKK